MTVWLCLVVTVVVVSGSESVVVSGSDSVDVTILMCLVVTV